MQKKVMQFKKLSVITSVLLTGLYSLSGFSDEAAQGFEPYYYGGGGLSFTFIEPEESGSSLYYVSDDKDMGFRLQGGYRYSEEWGFEFVYADLGEAGISISIPPGNEVGAVSYTAQVLEANYFFDKSVIPFELPYDWFLKGGLARLGLGSSGGVPYDVDNTLHIMLGLGVENDIKDNWQWRADLDLLSSDASALSIGVQYKFKPLKELPPPVEEPKDSDMDGVFDEQDQCPGTLEGVVVDETGCELPKEKVVEQAFKQLDFKGINFEKASEKLTDTSLDVLQETARIMMLNDTVKVEVRAHTDSDGTEAFNQKLSQRRAEAVRNYLIGQGVNESSITAVGMGETHPIADNTTKEGKAANRRVEFHVVQEEVIEGVESEAAIQ